MNNLTKNKWITKGIKISCNNKRKLYLNYKQNPNVETRKYYRLYSKILTNVIKEAKIIHYNKKVLTSSNKCNTTWDIINEITGHRHAKIDPQDLKVDHKHITNPEEIAELFNKYFSLQENDGIKFKSQNKLSNESKAKCYLKQDDKLYSTPFVLKMFSTMEISSIIKSIKTKNTHGYDEISTKILKISTNYIISPLTCICNRIILSAYFPDRLKYSIIKPVYKKGDKANYSNYRPISLLTSFSKIFEKAIYIRLTEYLLKNKIFVDSQYGF
jgi:Notch-like protein